MASVQGPWRPGLHPELRLCASRTRDWRPDRHRRLYRRCERGPPPAAVAGFLIAALTAIGATGAMSSDARFPSRFPNSQNDNRRVAQDRWDAGRLANADAAELGAISMRLKICGRKLSSGTLCRNGSSRPTSASTCSRGTSKPRCRSSKRPSPPSSRLSAKRIRNFAARLMRFRKPRPLSSKRLPSPPMCSSAPDQYERRGRRNLGASLLDQGNLRAGAPH